MAIQQILIYGFLFLGGLLMQGFDLLSGLGLILSISGFIALLVALYKDITHDPKSDDHNKEDHHEDS